jgi:hypothetical protein
MHRARRKLPKRFDRRGETLEASTGLLAEITRREQERAPRRNASGLATTAIDSPRTTRASAAARVADCPVFQPVSISARVSSICAAGENTKHGDAIRRAQSHEIESRK